VSFRANDACGTSWNRAPWRESIALMWLDSRGIAVNILRDGAIFCMIAVFRAHVPKNFWHFMESIFRAGAIYMLCRKFH